ncbi:unnamed protein product [Toxocara canis]|uniref:MFS domain-containing protein n=1 Tax=Toxocara canis TaxID=6265 RepID=A0A183VB70_TOXCA|nr:unnamed protein product [Toxocara canis]
MAQRDPLVSMGLLLEFVVNRDRLLSGDPLLSMGLRSLLSSALKQLKPSHHEGSVKYEGLDGETVHIGEPEDALQPPSPDKKPTSFTVDEAVELLGFGKFQIKLSILTGLAWGLTCSALMTFSMGAFSALSPNYYSLLVFRALTGFGIGGVPQS